MMRKNRQNLGHRLDFEIFGEKKSYETEKDANIWSKDILIAQIHISKLECDTVIHHI